MCKRLFILLFCCISCSQFNEQESNDSSQVIPIDEAIMKMNLKTSLWRYEIFFRVHHRCDYCV